jgi:single-strand DNA-binding protein
MEDSMAVLRMPEVNFLMIAGNLTRDPIYRQTTTNVTVANFSIAANRRYKDSNNNWQEDVCFLSIVAWNKLAESCRNKLKKGAAVLIEGELQSKTWIDDEGRNRYNVEVKARRIQFLSRKYRSSFSANDMNGFDDDENVIETEEAEIDYTEDSFDKFLSSEESDLINEKN